MGINKSIITLATPKILPNKSCFQLIPCVKRIFRVPFSRSYAIELNPKKKIETIAVRYKLCADLIKNIKNGKIKDVYDDGYFTTKKTLKDIEASLTRIDTSDLGIEQLNAGEEVSEEYIVRNNLSAADVSDYQIKGIWYFDKRQGELKYRILGLCPIVVDVFTMDSEEKDYVPLFWIFYPTIRDILHEAKSYNPNNSAAAFSFDHLFNSRRFNAMIYKEENLMGDRDIKSYIKDHSLMQLLESERIKEVIRDFEQDMWNY